MDASGQGNKFDLDGHITFIFTCDLRTPLVIIQVNIAHKRDTTSYILEQWPAPSQPAFLSEAGGQL